MSDNALPAATTWGTADRWSLRIILVGVSSYAAIVLAIGIVSTIANLASGDRTLSLFVNQDLPAAADDGTAAIVDGRLDNATIRVTDLSAGASTLLLAANIIGTVTQLAVALAFVYLCWRLLRREPFLRSLYLAFLSAGAALTIGSVVEQGLRGIGSWTVITELGGGTPDSDSFWPLTLSFDGGPVGLGIALMIVAVAFEHGQKLARDTEGLV